MCFRIGVPAIDLTIFAVTQNFLSYNELVLMRHSASIIVFFLSLTLIGCDSPDQSKENIATDFSSIGSTVEGIHTLFNQQEFETLYQQATSSAQNSFEEKQFLDFANHLRSTLGKVQNAEIANQMETGSGQTAVILDVEYQNDSGTERWILEQVDGQWHWTEFNYNAQSLKRGN